MRMYVHNFTIDGYKKKTDRNMVHIRSIKANKNEMPTKNALNDFCVLR